MSSTTSVSRARASETASDEAVDARQFIRLAGWSGLAAVVILVVSDFAILQAVSQPEPNAPAAEIGEWVSDNSGRLRAANGIQIAYLPLFGLFFAGVYSMLRSSRNEGWSVVGLIGSSVVVTVAAIGSATAAVMFWRADLLVDELQLTLAIWSINHAIFLVLAVGYALAFVGFGIAGRRNGLVPRWTAVVGYTCAITGTVSTLFIAETLDVGWSEPFEFLTFLLALVWFTAMSVVLIRRGEPAVRE